MVAPSRRCLPAASDHDPQRTEAFMGVLGGILKKGRLLVLLLVVAVAIIGFVFRNQVSGSANDLKVGDCFDVPAGKTVTDVQHHPCTDPHTGEVSAVFDYPNAPDTFPGQAAIDSVGKDRCTSAFQAYTGFALDSTQAASINAGYFYPDPSTWSQDKSYICYLTPSDGQPVSVSYRAPSH